MIKTSPVRRATIEDEQDLLDMCTQLHDENGWQGMDTERVRAMLNRAFMRGGGIVGVIGRHGQLQASIYLLLTQAWFTNDFHLEELWAFVRPSYRHTDNAKELIKFAQRCADEIGVRLAIGIFSSNRTEAKIRLYRRYFREPHGAYWLYTPLEFANATSRISMAS